MYAVVYQLVAESSLCSAVARPDDPVGEAAPLTRLGLTDPLQLIRGERTHDLQYVREFLIRLPREVASPPAMRTAKPPVRRAPVSP